jgi:hypothetical protein
MKQINVRVGQCPYNNKFESTINGINKPFKETLKLADEMFTLGSGNPITIDGESYVVEKALFVGNRIIAEAHSK